MIDSSISKTDITQVLPLHEFSFLGSISLAIHHLGFETMLPCGVYKDTSVAAQNDCFGDQFGVLRQPLRLAAAAAAIEKAQ